MTNETINSDVSATVTHGSSTTHLTPIKIWADENSDADNASMEFDDKNIKPTFIFRMGIPGSSYGIEIAQRMGLESEIISNATNNLSNKSFQLEKLLSSINKEKMDLEEKLIYTNSLKVKLEDKELRLNQLENELSKNKKLISKNRESELRNEILGYRKKLENVVYEILECEIEGTTGCVKVRDTYLGISFLDTLSFIKNDGEWRIYNKLFNVESE